MTQAAETFVISLARASRRAKRYLRGLSRDDQDDILSTAILWCWENKATYNPSVKLDDWFIGAIRNARKTFERGEAKNSGELAEVIGVAEDASWPVAVRQAVSLMVRSMDERDQQIMHLRMDGLEPDEIAIRSGIPWQSVYRRMERLRALIPEPDTAQPVQRTYASDSDRANQGLAPIDKEIEQLEFAPQMGRECTPCWLCKWFDGYLPAERKSLRMQIVEPEVREAVVATETRKVEIAKLVRAGLFRS